MTTRAENEEARQLLEAYQTTQTPGMKWIEAMIYVEREAQIDAAKAANRTGEKDRAMVAFAVVDGLDKAISVIRNIKVQYENELDRQKEVKSNDEDDGY